MADLNIYYLELTVARGSAEARVNDIPVYRETTDNPAVLTIPIHEYLIEGENTLKLIATPEDPENPEGFEARVRIARFEAGKPVGFSKGFGLADIAWSEDLKGSPVATAFEVTDPFRWLWESAPVVELDSDVRATLDAYVIEVCDLYRDKDAKALLTELDLYFSDLAKAYPAPLGAPYSPDEFLSDWQDVPQPWVVEPFTPSPANYRLVAGGRMVDCVGPDLKPLVRNKVEVDGTEVDDFAMPMMVAFKAGKPVVVR